MDPLLVEECLKALLVGNEYEHCRSHGGGEVRYFLVHLCMRWYKWHVPSRDLHEDRHIPVASD